MFGFNTYTKKIVNYISKDKEAGYNSIETEPLDSSKMTNKKLIAPWGDSNNFPAELDAKIAFSENFETAFQTLSEFAYGLGIKTYKKELIDGEVSMKPYIFPEWEEWKIQYSFNEEYLEKAFYNFVRYANVFVEFSMGSDNKIKRLFVKDAPWCRVSNLDNTGTIKNLYLSASWSKYRNPTEADVNALKTKNLIDIIPLIDRKNPFEFLANVKQGTSCAWHIKDYSPGDPYYGKSPWYPLLNNGWLELSKELPSKIKSYYQNQIVIAKHIEINTEYLEKKYSDWNTLTPEQRELKLKELQAQIDEALSGSEDAYKSIHSQFIVVQGKEIPALKISNIENSQKDNSIIKDSQHLASIIQSALRIDDALVNGKNTGSKEADAGSEKRSAHNLLEIRTQLFRDKILYPLVLLQKHNKWDETMVFDFDAEMLTTTDISKTGTVQKTPTP